MCNALDHTIRRLAALMCRLQNDQTGAIPVDAGFSFSAWFFVTAVALTFLDTYVLGGRGIQTYFEVPTNVLAASRSLVNF